MVRKCKWTRSAVATSAVFAAVALVVPASGSVGAMSSKGGERHSLPQPPVRTTESGRPAGGVAETAKPLPWNDTIEGKGHLRRSQGWAWFKFKRRTYNVNPRWARCQGRVRAPNYFDFGGPTRVKLKAQLRCTRMPNRHRIRIDYSMSYHKCFRDHPGGPFHPRNGWRRVKHRKFDMWYTISRSCRMKSGWNTAQVRLSLFGNRTGGDLKKTVNWIREGL